MYSVTSTSPIVAHNHYREIGLHERFIDIEGIRNKGKAFHELNVGYTLEQVIEITAIHSEE